MNKPVNATPTQTATNSLICLKKKHLKAVDFCLSVLSQAHTDLSELCEVVCSKNQPLSANVFADLNHIQSNIDSVCKEIEGYTADSRFCDVYEDFNLADSLLTCLVITIWTQDKPPTYQPLEWREAVVIYGVAFSTMHRLGNALNALKAVIV